MRLRIARYVRKQMDKGGYSAGKIIDRPWCKRYFDGGKSCRSADKYDDTCERVRESKRAYVERVPCPIALDEHENFICLFRDIIYPRTLVEYSRRINRDNEASNKQQTGF